MCYTLYVGLKRKQAYMEKIYSILLKLYPNINFRIIQGYEYNEGEDIHYYELYIEDRISEEFDTLDDLEKFILNDYKLDCIKQAEEILENEED